MRPNIILIMSDQHNPHVMGCEGNRVVRTLNLDALAKGGVRFTSAYCPSPLCVPSRAGFMTAKYPSRVECYDNGGILSPEAPTFAHALSRAGYETVLCGRMHFEGEDQFHGFEKRLAGDCMHWLTDETRGVRPNSLDGQTAPAVAISGYGRTGYEAYDEFVTQKACEFLSSCRGGPMCPPSSPFERQEAKQKEGPHMGGPLQEKQENRSFCLVVGTMLPHNPLIARKDLFEYYLARVTCELPSEDELRRMHPAIRVWRERRGVDELTPEQHRRALAAYCALVTEMDENVGRIVAAARAADPDAVVIYTSDHGDMASEHGMWWKSCFFEGSARVPLIISRADIPVCHSVRTDRNVCPTRKDGGADIPVCPRAVDAVVSLLDLGPTLIDLAGGEPMSDVDGRSLVPFLEGTPPADWPSETFSEYGGAHGDPPSCMVRSGEWKRMYYSEFDPFDGPDPSGPLRAGSCLLFNLREDPREQRDRAGDPACREVVERLRAKILSRWSAKAVSDGMERQRLARLCGPKPGWPAAWESPAPEDNAFDRSQLPG